MVTLVAPAAAVALAVALPVALAVAVAVLGALELGVEDLLLEQPAKPPTTITAPQTVTNRARFTTVLLCVVTRGIGGPAMQYGSPPVGGLANG
jgi:hypothetical protein